MKALLSILVTFLAVVASEPQASKRSHTYTHWPAKSAKQISNPKTKTLMVQIRSDHPVPLVFKGRPGSTHAHGHYVQHPHSNNYGQNHLGLPAQRRPRPIKLSAPMYLKSAPMKQLLRQPLKIKFSNNKPHSKPLASNYDKPYKYEKPISMSYSDYFGAELPTTTKANFISEHFVPIHTIRAPNLALHDNHIHNYEEVHAPTPKPQPYHQFSSTSYKNTNSNTNNNHLDHQYQVLEEITNDATFVDPISDSQKLFAPDPDPSLPTSKVRPAQEPYNQPSNGKPLPNDVQNNNLLSVQPLVQIVGAQQAKLTASDIYPLALSTHQQQQPQLQPFVSEHLTAIQAAPLPNYNPTYLVTQSNNLYSQHKQQQQQLFQPHTINGYANADLTQEVASDGQIFQAAKHSLKEQEFNYEAIPQFAALIAAPALGTDHASAQVAPFSIPNVGAGAIASQPEGGFVISNYYNNNGIQDSSQLLQAYAEEEAQHQQFESDKAALELQQQQQQQQHQAEQQEILQQQVEQQRHQQQQQQQQQLQLQQIHEAARAQHQLSPSFLQEQPVKTAQHIDAAAAAFEEHQRLVQQHLGSNTPLRIFVPDDDDARLQKRSEKAASQNTPSHQKSTASN